MMLLRVEGFNTSAITADPEPNLWIGAILDVGLCGREGQLSQAHDCLCGSLCFFMSPVADGSLTTVRAACSPCQYGRAIFVNIG